MRVYMSRLWRFATCLAAGVPHVLSRAHLTSSLCSYLGGYESRIEHRHADRTVGSDLSAGCLFLGASTRVHC